MRPVAVVTLPKQVQPVAVLLGSEVRLVSDDVAERHEKLQ